MLIHILILRAINATYKSKRFTSQSSLQAFKRYISDMTFFCRFFCHTRISLICLVHLSLLNLYFYTSRSITMLLKVLNNVNFNNRGTKINYFLLLTYCRLRVTFVLQLLKFSHGLVDL